MATIYRIDDRRFRRRIGAMQRELNPAGIMFNAVVASEITRFAILAGPKDTNTYVRSWQTAHNKLVPLAGGRISPVTVFPLRESKYSRQNRHRLERQVQKWELVVQNLQVSIAWMESRPNHEKWLSYQRAKRNLRKAQAALDTARQQIARIDSPGGGSAIVIGGRKTKSFFATTGLATARVGLYPGEARVVSVGRRSVIEVRNRAPHAHIVEARTRIVTQAVAASRSRGLRVGRSSYVARLASASLKVA